MPERDMPALPEPNVIEPALWAAIERYADEVCEFNTAVRIDVGIDAAGRKCLAAQKDAEDAIRDYARAHAAALERRVAELEASIKAREGYGARVLAEVRERAEALKPACWCHACRPVTLEDMRMVLCPNCGNKRCPHANDHRNACTNSNATGQPGSAYP